MTLDGLNKILVNHPLELAAGTLLVDAIITYCIVIFIISRRWKPIHSVIVQDTMYPATCFFSAHFDFFNTLNAIIKAPSAEMDAYSRRMAELVNKKLVHIREGGEVITDSDEIETHTTMLRRRNSQRMERYRVEQAEQNLDLLIAEVAGFKEAISLAVEGIGLTKSGVSLSAMSAKVKIWNILKSADLQLRFLRQEMFSPPLTGREVTAASFSGIDVEVLLLNYCNFLKECGVSHKVWSDFNTSMNSTVELYGSDKQTYLLEKIKTFDSNGRCDGDVS